MPQEYRYPLTRVCLRHGALTLPRTMLELFPESGDVTAVDATNDQTFALTVIGPRSVGGFSSYFKAHELEVNDELLIRPLDDGRFSVTAVSRHRSVEDDSQQVLRAVLDELADANVPVTEAEIRALYPDVSEAVDLRSVLVADGRFVHHQGRWQLESRVLEEARSAEAEALAAASGAGGDSGPSADMVGVADLGGSGSSAETAAAVLGGAPAPYGDHNAVRGGDMTIGGHGGDDDAAISGEPSDGRLEQGGEPGSYGIDDGGPAHHGEQTALWAQGAAAADLQMPPPSFASSSSATSDAGAHGGSGERDAAASDRADGHAGRGGASEGSVERLPVESEPPEEDVTRDPYREEEGPDLRMIGRARSALSAFGYRVESLGQGQLLAHADLGRRHHTVLVRALAYGERLDWAALLSRRRGTAANYVAVFGDYRDLHRLQGPADLARATLWSWDGVERALGLSRAVPVSPYDLEPHFLQGGLYDQGLERFERTMAERVGERGEFSELLTRLAGMRAPRVFLLEELAGDSHVSRDHVLKVLERLSDAPFHLVARVDQGEFCLRQPVGSALDNFVEYARSLQSRLPNRKRARVTGFSDPNAPFDPDAESTQGATRSVEPGAAEAAGPDAASEDDDVLGAWRDADELDDGGTERGFGADRLSAGAGARKDPDIDLLD